MSGIVNGQVGITAETTARLAATLGTTAQYWLNLQNGSTYTTLRDNWPRATPGRT
jgi:plasmid maintenance system antidote protein VapI